jgi:hypothetical protein
MTDSIAKKLGAVIAPAEGGMPEMLRADPDVQSGLLAVIAQLRADLAKYMHAFTYTNEQNTQLQDELDQKYGILREAREALRPWADLGEDLEPTEKRMLLSADCDDLRRAVLAFTAIDAVLKETKGGDSEIRHD